MSRHFFRNNKITQQKFIIDNIKVSTNDDTNQKAFTAMQRSTCTQPNNINNKTQHTTEHTMYAETTRAHTVCVPCGVVRAALLLQIATANG